MHASAMRCRSTVARLRYTGVAAPGCGLAQAQQEGRIVGAVPNIFHCGSECVPSAPHETHRRDRLARRKSSSPASTRFRKASRSTGRVRPARSSTPFTDEFRPPSRYSSKSRIASATTDQGEGKNHCSSRRCNSAFHCSSVFSGNSFTLRRAVSGARRYTSQITTQQ